MELILYPNMYLFNLFLEGVGITQDGKVLIHSVGQYRITAQIFLFFVKLHSVMLQMSNLILLDFCLLSTTHNFIKYILKFLHTLG